MRSFFAVLLFLYGIAHAYQLPEFYLFSGPDWESDTTIFWSLIDLGETRIISFLFIWFIPGSMFAIASMGMVTRPSQIKETLYGAVFLSLMMSFLELPNEIIIFGISVLLAIFLFIERHYKWIFKPQKQRYIRL